MLVKVPALVRSASRQVASPNPNGLSIPNTLATQFLPVTCPRLARTSCPRTLSLQNVSLGSCHCETCRIHGVAISSPTTCPWFLSLRTQTRFSAKPKCEPATSHTCGVVEAIYSPLDRRTAFAMTIYTTLVMTKNKMATSS